jgi:hypothetical protein
MASPTVSAALNAASYAPGALMTLTVNYADADSQPLTVFVTVQDAAGNVSAPASVQVNITDALTITVSDSGGRTWTKVSDSGGVAVYTAVA